MLHLEGVVAGYGSGVVLDGVTLQLESGRVTALLGHNGAGKTTLLKTIMGLVHPQAGRILLNSVDLAGKPPFAVARAGVAYVPQGREIFGAFSVEDNLRLGDLSNDDLSASFALFPVLEAFRVRKAGDLSGGQQQQLAIARALRAKPKLLLLDEPSEGVQPNIVRDIGRAIRRIVDETGLCVLLVEQNLDLVSAIADNIAFLRDGRVEVRAPHVDKAMLTERLGL